MKHKIYWLPLLLFAVLCVFLWRGLSLHPRELPSVLLGKPAPHFDLPDLFAPQRHLTQQVYIGRLTLLNVWASWCETCTEEQAFLSVLKRSTPRLQIIGVDFQDQPAQALAWLQHYGNPYDRVLSDVSGRMGVDYGVYGTPESFLIDERGIVRAKISGVLNASTWRQMLAHYPLNIGS